MTSTPPRRTSPGLARLMMRMTPQEKASIGEYRARVGRAHTAVKRGRETEENLVRRWDAALRRLETGESGSPNFDEFVAKEAFRFDLFRMQQAHGRSAGENCTAIHWRHEGDELDVRLVWSIRGCDCAHSHRSDVVYWGLCHCPLTGDEDSYDRRKRDGKPWFWFAGYRLQPSSIAWFETKAEAIAEGAQLEQDSSRHNRPAIRCDRVAEDYRRSLDDQERRATESGREYAEWQQQQQGA